MNHVFKEWYDKDDFNQIDLSYIEQPFIDKIFLKP